MRPAAPDHGEAVSLAACIDTLAGLVAHRTPSAEPNLALVAALHERLAAAGARVEVLESPERTHATLFATFGPAADGGLMLSAHTDTVPATAAEGWRGEPFRLRQEGDRLIGRGACDMKGFLACVLESLPAFAAAARRSGRPVHIALTHDEEMGCRGARQLAAHLAAHGPRPGWVLVGEPTGLRVVDGHKGCFEYVTRIRGRDGHASDPGAGVNAAEIAACLAAELVALRDELDARAAPDSPFAPPGTTLSVGRIAGGTASNVIAAEAELHWEMRPVAPADAGLVHDRVAAFVARTLPGMRARAPEAAIATEVIGEVEGLLPRPRNALRDAALAAGAWGPPVSVPFGTEAGL